MFAHKLIRDRIKSLLVLPAHCAQNDYRHISCRMTSTYVGNDSDKNAKGILKEAIINNQNAPSQNKLKLTGVIISFVNTLKFSKRNNETSTVRE